MAGRPDCTTMLRAKQPIWAVFRAVVLFWAGGCVLGGYLAAAERSSMGSALQDRVTIPVIMVRAINVYMSCSVAF
ncbi:MAG: hypothetical protein ACI9JM_000113 [Halioglobus sp.]|jgi:hypothetical protein